MHITNAYVFTETAQFVRKDISIAGQYITDSSLSDSETIDATGLYAIPGLIDIHFHGCVGHDFSDGTLEALNAIASYQAKHGVTALCPATVTLGRDTLRDICQVASTFEAEDHQADLIGIHLEGPFISPNMVGAQNPAFIQTASLEMFRELQEASGELVKILSLAPETEGTLALIEAIKDEVTCSIAHTTATYDIAHQAFLMGASHVTHLFNAMSPFHHREPGVVGAAFDEPECMVELVVDGIHLHPAVVRAAISMFGEDRVVFVSDSMRATGLADGQYTLGGLDVTVAGRRATLTKAGNIAGSVTNLMESVRLAVREMDIPLETAVRCASMNAAIAINEFESYGSITPGKVADIVLVDEDLTIHQIIVRGEPLL